MDKRAVKATALLLGWRELCRFKWAASGGRRFYYALINDDLDRAFLKNEGGWARAVRISLDEQDALPPEGSHESPA
jgi:hypothetical protein